MASFANKFGTIKVVEDDEPVVPQKKSEKVMGHGREKKAVAKPKDAPKVQDQSKVEEGGFEMDMG